MIEESTFSVLALAAVSVGALHSLAPDHWVPFAALSRAHGWTPGKTARIILGCGLGHVTVSAVLAFAALSLGTELLEAVGGFMAAGTGVLLICLGLTYGAWSLHRAMARKRMGDAAKLSVYGLFVLFCLDPCVAVIPLVFASASLGRASALVVVLLYALATIGAMLLFVVPIRLWLGRWSPAWLDGYGEAVAGGAIVAVGLAAFLFGF